jgi:CheY-like chemotaxis protein
MVKKILIIDDDLDFIEACQNMLEAVDYEVASEHRRDKVIDKISEFCPDLVLLDVLMDNQLAGFEIAAHLCGDKKQSSIAIIFLTGYFMRTGLRELQNELIHKWPSVKFVLDKPVRPAKLLETIRQLDVTEEQV